MKRIIEDVKKYNKYNVYSAMCVLKSEVAGSRLSWLWWILDPLLFMLVYMFVALVVFGKGEQYFPIFVFIGLTTWQFFEYVVKGSVKLVAANSAIVTKVYIPKYCLIIQRILARGFKMGISFGLVGIMMILFQVPISLKILYVIPLFIVLFLVTFGIATILMHYGVFLEDISNMITVVMRLLFYMSGIFYNISNRVPEPYASLLEKCNPIAFVISELRNVMLYNTSPDVIALVIWFVVGCIMTLNGIRIVYKYENSYAKVI